MNSVFASVIVMVRATTALSKPLTTYINCRDSVEHRVRAENEIETISDLDHTRNGERFWIRQMKKSLLRGQLPDAVTSDTVPSPDAIQTRSQTMMMVFSGLIQLACCPVIILYDPSHSAYHKVVSPMWTPDGHPSTDIAVITNI